MANYQPQYKNSWALVIGVNKYIHAGPLAIARADAESITAALTEKLGFPAEQVISLLDKKATRAKIMEKFLSFDSLNPDDRLFVFFAGHGMTFEGQKGPIGYLVPVDGNPNDKSTLIRWDDLTRSADLIPAKHILFVMDACYSGLAIQRAMGVGEQRFISDMLLRRSRQVVTAGKADETVADGGGPTGTNSIFTGHFLEGLNGKAVNENGVLTASHLMNYVYQKVSNDPCSSQSPHFGHIDGDGDFVLLTPNDAHLTDRPLADFLVKPIIERPEPPHLVSTITLKPVFAEKNGYGDPENEKFGQNEWTAMLFEHQSSPAGSSAIARAKSWLSIVVEPVSNQPIQFDLVSLAKNLRSQPQSEKPYEQFQIPTEAMTTAKSLILSDSQRHEQKEWWKRFLRIEKNGALEYAQSAGITRFWRNRQDETTGVRIFSYVQLIGIVWNFLFAAKRILNHANYNLGVRCSVNLIGTRDTMLVQFADRGGAEGKKWTQPFEPMASYSSTTWKCHDENLQISFQFVLDSLGEQEAKRIIAETAEYLGLAYNHQSSPRCFNYKTDEFPWEQFNPHH